ncbi:MAG: GvpL/GvpF family gas vesicle protein, partial [Pseudomonadota bacterium]
MTALVLHGIVHASTPAPFAAPTHRQVLAGRLCGIATVVRPGAFEKDDPSTLNDVRLHHELLTAYAATSDLLPVRFGAFFSDEAALLDALQQDEAAHISKLTRLSDCVEYLLKLTSGAEQDGGRAQPDPHQHPQDGRSFLQRKRSVRDDRRNLMAKQAAFASALPSELSGI